MGPHPKRKLIALKRAPKAAAARLPQLPFATRRFSNVGATESRQRRLKSPSDAATRAEPAAAAGRGLLWFATAYPAAVWPR